jgi:hypothetical protein
MRGMCVNIRKDIEEIVLEIADWIKLAQATDN